MVPTKDHGPSKKSKVPEKYKLKDHPIFFKNSRIESQIPQFNSKTNSSSKQKTQQSSRKNLPSSSEMLGSQSSS